MDIPENLPPARQRPVSMRIISPRSVEPPRKRTFSMPAAIQRSQAVGTTASLLGIIAKLVRMRIVSEQERNEAADQGDTALLREFLSSMATSPSSFDADMEGKETFSPFESPGPFGAPPPGLAFQGYWKPSEPQVSIPTIPEPLFDDEMGVGAQDDDVQMLIGKKRPHASVGDAGNGNSIAARLRISLSPRTLELRNMRQAGSGAADRGIRPKQPPHSGVSAAIPSQGPSRLPTVDSSTESPINPAIWSWPAMRNSLQLDATGSSGRVGAKEGDRGGVGGEDDWERGGGPQLAETAASPVGVSGGGAPAQPRKWTKAEDELLKRAVKQHGGKDWKKIASMVPGRNHEQCLQRWRKVLQPGLRKGPWMPEEDAILRQAIEENPAFRHWGVIANRVPGRTAKQCRQRWRNYLDPSLSNEEWTSEQDQELLELVQQYDGKWSKVAEHLPGRSDLAVKSRWKFLTQASNKQRKQRRPARSRPRLAPSPVTPVVTHAAYSMMDSAGNSSPSSSSPSVLYPPAPLSPTSHGGQLSTVPFYSHAPYPHQPPFPQPQPLPHPQPSPQPQPQPQHQPQGPLVHLSGLPSMQMGFSGHYQMHSGAFAFSSAPMAPQVVLPYQPAHASHTAFGPFSTHRGIGRPAPPPATQPPSYYMDPTGPAATWGFSASTAASFAPPSTSADAVMSTFSDPPSSIDPSGHDLNILPARNPISSFESNRSDDQLPLPLYHSFIEEDKDMGPGVLDFDPTLDGLDPFLDD